MKTTETPNGTWKLKKIKIHLFIYIAIELLNNINEGDKKSNQIWLRVTLWLHLKS